MAEKIKIVCKNRYFRDKVHGVQFTPATGGAVGYATAKQAEKFEGEKAFRVEGAVEAEVSAESNGAKHSVIIETLGKMSLVQTQSQESVLQKVKGIGPATAVKLEALGIDVLGKLVIADTAQLANDLGEKPDVVEAWQTAAREIIQ